MYAYIQSNADCVKCDSIRNRSTDVNTNHVSAGNEDDRTRAHVPTPEQNKYHSTRSKEVGTPEAL